MGRTDEANPILVSGPSGQELQREVESSRRGNAEAISAMLAARAQAPAPPSTQLQRLADAPPAWSPYTMLT